MKFDSHMAGGAVAYMSWEVVNKQVLGNAVPSAPTYVTGVGMAILGGPLNDLDQSGSYWTHRFFGLPTIISWFFKHRGFTHSSEFIVCSGITLAFLSSLFGDLSYAGISMSTVFLGLFFGLFSHFLLDMLTPSGVWGSFFLEVKWKVPVVTTGQSSEKLFQSFMAFIGVGLGIHYLMFWLESQGVPATDLINQFFMEAQKHV